ncbi:hypothetical protein QEN19_001247 [Hanseniaspora menglaensis]
MVKTKNSFICSNVAPTLKKYGNQLLQKEQRTVNSFANCFFQLKFDIQITLFLFIVIPILKFLLAHNENTIIVSKNIDSLLVEFIFTFRFSHYFTSILKQDFTLSPIFESDFKSKRFWKTISFLLLPFQVFLALKFIVLTTGAGIVLNKSFGSKPLGVLFGASVFKYYLEKLFEGFRNYSNINSNSAFLKIDGNSNDGSQIPSIIFEYEDASINDKKSSDGNIDKANETFTELVKQKQRFLFIVRNFRNEIIFKAHIITLMILKIMNNLKYAVIYFIYNLLF